MRFFWQKGASSELSEDAIPDLTNVKINLVRAGIPKRLVAGLDYPAAHAVLCKVRILVLEGVDISQLFNRGVQNESGNFE